MNKTIQAIEPSKLFSLDPPGVANRNGHDEAAEGSFSSILSRSEGGEAGQESGQILHTTGNKLPAEQARAEDQQYAVDAPQLTEEQATAALAIAAQAGTAQPTATQINTSGMPDVDEASLFANTRDLPEPVEIQTFLQPELVADVSLMTRAPGVTGEPVLAGELMPARTEAQQLQGQVVDVRVLAQAAPGNLPVSNDQIQNNIVREFSVVRDGAATFPSAADASRIASDAEPGANAVREAVQLALANQAPGQGLKQFLQQNRNQPAATNILPVSSTAETPAVPFLQTLSDNALIMPSARIQVPVGQSGWGRAVGEQVVWFVSQNIHAASLRLNPQHLGPIEMEVSMNGDQANVSFTSQHGLVRDALESSIPRLREMLSENGLNLANVNVSQHGRSG